MIRYVRGNLLEAPAEALINTVNEIGVMGKGIALMFHDSFPDSAREYEEAAKAGNVKVGRMLATRNPSLIGPRWIIHFPTKKHWRQPSKMEWVRSGLNDLVRVVREENIHSIAVPPLGCGNGGLEWSQVKSEIESAAAHLPDVEVIVYEPTNEYQNAPKREGIEELTPARALIAELVRRYSVLGLECTNLEVQKIAWFISREIEELNLHDPLDLRFIANRYGPYADRLRHLLNGLDGSYLHCEKRLADAGPLDLIWFEDAKRELVKGYLESPDAARYFRNRLFRLFPAAVAVEYDRFCVLENGLVLRPALARHHGPHAGSLREPSHHQRATGEVFVLPGLVADAAGEQNNLREFRVLRVGFERDLGLVEGISGAQRRGKQRQQQREATERFHAAIKHQRPYVAR